MLLSKTFVVVFFLCFVHGCVSKPTTENDMGEGRGIVSSIWGWITYPFYWWGSGDTEQPVSDQLVGSVTYDPNDIDVRTHNVTIWCNDQTCTTMKCDKVECRNITCNLYDTDFRGECREYNIVTKENIVSKPTETMSDVSVQNKPTDTPIKTPGIVISNENTNFSTADEHPLELEAVLSSSVNTHAEVKPPKNKDNFEVTIDNTKA